MAKLKPLSRSHAQRLERGVLESKPSDYAVPGAAALVQRNIRKAIEDIEEAKRLRRELDWLSNYEI